jgi:hypothetical protein
MTYGLVASKLLLSCATLPGRFSSRAQTSILLPLVSTSTPDPDGALGPSATENRSVSFGVVGAERTRHEEVRDGSERQRWGWTAPLAAALGVVSRRRRLVVLLAAVLMTAAAAVVGALTAPEAGAIPPCPVQALPTARNHDLVPAQCSPRGKSPAEVLQNGAPEW